jgi:hypothetical protein
MHGHTTLKFVGIIYDCLVIKSFNTIMTNIMSEQAVKKI